MNQETLEALRKSIDKWSENARAERTEDVLMGVNDCPLCDIFYRHNLSCKYCPVMLRTGKQYCAASPYVECSEKYMEWVKDRNSSKARKEYCISAEREVAFLQNLLPDGDPWREDAVRSGT